MRQGQKLFPFLLIAIILVSLPFLESLSWATSNNNLSKETKELVGKEYKAEKAQEIAKEVDHSSDSQKSEQSEKQETDGDVNKESVEKEGKPKNLKNKGKTKESGEKTTEKSASKDKQKLTKESKRDEFETKNSVNNDKVTESSSLVTPFVGNFNIDIDISPYKKEILSGNDASYKLVLKATGSQTKYTDVIVTVDLPIEEFSQFSQDLEELKIAGVEPTYDVDKQKLVYEIAELKAGQTYETLIEVNTTNGEIANDTKLIAVASFEANEQEKLTDEATVLVKASNSLAVSKQFKEARSGGNVQKAPFPGSYTIWDIKVNIPKKDVGQLYLKEGSKITVTDTFSSGLTYYDVMDGTPEPNRSGRTLTWEFDAPTIIEQAEAEGDLLTLDLRVRLQVNNNANLVGTTQENEVTVEATTIDNETITKTVKDTIPIVDRDSATGDILGNIMHPNHFGPADEKGNGASSDKKDPNPDVYDDAYLQFRHGITSMHPGKKYDMEEYRVHYIIDENLVLNNIRTPGNFYFARNQEEASQYIPLARKPEFNIVGMINGSLTTLVTNAEHGTTYTREDLGLIESDHVTEIRYVFPNAPAGMYARQLALYHFDVKPGYIGQVKNEYDVHVIPDQRAINEGLPNNNGIWSYKSHSANTWKELASDRHAEIVPRTDPQPPVATVGIELLDHNGGEVTYGDNRMSIKLRNEASSPATISGPLESVVLLPLGVTLSGDPQATYTDTNGNNSSGNYEVLNNDYNGSGRQLVKINWNDTRIRVGKDVTAQLNVNITDNASTSLTFDVYGFSGEENLQVPTGSGATITDTILQTDADDLNGNGDFEEPRIKSGNVYTIRGQYDIQTEKLVKGELDDAWSHFGQTIPGGAIDYQVKLTNTTGKDITQLTLMDVLPSIGDLGITDNIDRGSQFTPSLTDPINLPAEWQDKVDIVYSTAKNPKRDDLIEHTLYPGTTTPLTNPQGAEEPNWVSESAITEWTTIHSFKMTLKSGVEWIKGDDITIEFSMVAPELKDVEHRIVDASIEPTERAAWNSFAVATEHGQPVEPVRVGVYMDYEIEEPEVEKTVNKQKEPYNLISRDEEFTWEIDYDFGNYTADWESVSFRDELNDLLEIIDVTITDQAGNDVSGNGELTIDRDKNTVTFNLNKQDDSFAYLTDQTYTMIIKTKISDQVTDEQLIEIIETGGIPNEADLVIDDQPTTSNEVIIHPPLPNGLLTVTKIDERTEETLKGAQFELRDGKEEIVASGSTDELGIVVFENLPFGNYKLYETKAPKGYRLLTQPLDIVIDGDNLHVKIDVENSKTAWELPETGGIGTLVFYGLGALLMVGAGYLLFRRKPTN